MPKFRSEHYPQLQVGSGPDKIRFVDGEVEVSEKRAKSLRNLGAFGVVEVDPPKTPRRSSQSSESEQSE